MAAIPGTVFLPETAAQVAVSERFFGISTPICHARPSYRVTVSPFRTVQRDGITTFEMKVFGEALHMIRQLARQRRWPLRWIVFEAHHASELEARSQIIELQKRLTKYQDRSGIRTGSRFWLNMLEAKCQVHANIIVTAPQKGIAMIERLIDSAVFGSGIQIKRIDNADTLRDYLMKEATTQAAWSARQSGKGFRREKGSHPLGTGGGDRLKLSGDLRAALVAEKIVQPYKRTYAARSLVRPPIAAFSNSHLRTLPSAPTYQFCPHGMFGPLPDHHAPERAARSRPRPRLKYEVRHEGQADLGLNIENIVRLALHRIGGTHETYAARLGISRPQATNIMNGQFGASRTVVRRAIKLMRVAA